MKKSIFKINVINIVSLLLLFTSNLFLASKFGAGIDMDIYLSSSSIPIFITTILITALSVNFIPLFFNEKNNNEGPAFYSIINGIVLINLLIVVGLMAVINVFSKELSDMLVPGYTLEQREFYSKLIFFQTPFIILSFLNEILSNLLYCHQKYLIPILTKIFNPILLIIYISFGGVYISVKGLIFISTISVVLQTLLLFYRLIKISYFDFLFFSLINSKVKRYFKLSLPVVFIVIFTKIIPVFDRYLVSDLYEGSVSHLSYAYKLFSQIGPILSAGIMITIYPTLSEYRAVNDYNKVKYFASDAIKKLFFLSIPITVLFYFYGSYIIQFLYLRGKFSLNDSIVVSKILAIYLFALPYSLVGDILSKLFYVFNDTIRPALIGIIETIIYIVVAILLKPYVGIYALPISFAIYFNLSWVNALLIKRKLGGSGRHIIKLFILSFITAFISAIAIYYPISWFDSILIKMVVLLFGGISYLLIGAFIFKIDIALIYFVNIKSFLIENFNYK